MKELRVIKIMGILIVSPVALSMLVLGSLGILLRSTEVIHQFEK
jgi:hypothetical protein